jgi:hypothetical protein
LKTAPKVVNGTVAVPPSISKSSEPVIVGPPTNNGFTAVYEGASGSKFVPDQSNAKSYLKFGVAEIASEYVTRTESKDVEPDRSSGMTIGVASAGRGRQAMTPNRRTSSRAVLIGPPTDDGATSIQCPGRPPQLCTE